MKNFSYTLKAIWFFGPAVVTIILSYVMFAGLEAGQDVILVASASFAAVLLTTLCVLLWAFFLWYSSRLLAYEKMRVDPRWPDAVMNHMPRLIALNAFTSIQVGILSLKTFTDLSFWYLLLFILGQNGLYFLSLSIRDTTVVTKKWTLRGVAVLVSVVYVGYSVRAWLIMNDPAGDLALLVIVLFVVQVIFLYYIMHRRGVVEVQAVTYVPLRILGLSGLAVYAPKSQYANEVTIFHVFNVVAAIGAGIFVCSFSFFSFAQWAGPMSVVLLGLGILAGGFNGINMVSMRIKFNLAAGLLLIAWLFGALGPDLYRVELRKSPGTRVFQIRLSGTEYFKKWVHQRRARIMEKNSADPYNVYIILSDGGASRSGYWVASVLSAWQDQSMGRAGDLFSDHVFCLSGASGGSVGNATFYALLATNQGGGPTNLSRAKAFLANDFLSYTMARYIGPDLIRHILPFFPRPDRAGALADGMAIASDPYLHGAFDHSISTLIDTTGRLPILFMNSTTARDGVPAVVSTVKLNGFSKRVDILDTLDRLGSKDAGQGDISFATATILSARFPYISPAGRIGNTYYVDGGYFDNSGSGVVQELIEKLLPEIQRDTTLRARVRFNIIHISNTSPSKEPPAINPLMNDLATPLITVLGTYDSQTEINDTRLQNLTTRIGGSYHIVNLYRPGKKENYPMNWVISGFQLGKMDERLKEVTGPNRPF